MKGIHVALVMDGNRRWAARRGLPSWRGHLAGTQAIMPLLMACPGHGVETVTVFAFSSADWQRPPADIRHVLLLIEQFALAEGQTLRDAGVRVSAIGRLGRVPSRTASVLRALERMTAQGNRLHLRLAVDYSARFAITEAVAGAVSSSATSLDAAALDEEIGLGDPPLDFFIRTGGQRRISDFLLWEIAYAELFFTETLWPDFSPADLAEALRDYASRDRRFGGLSDRSATGYRRLAG